MFQYIYNFFRPKTVEQAAKNKLYLSIAYAILGWHAFIILLYKTSTKDLPTDPEQRKITILTRMNPNQDSKLIRIEGLSVVESRILKKPEPKEDLKQSKEEL